MSGDDSTEQIRGGTVVRPRGSRWRAGAYVFLVLSATAFAAANRADIPAAGRAFREAKPGWLICGALLMGVATTNQAMLHAAAQRAAGLDTRARAVVLPVAAGAFLNLVAKSGGMAGLAPLVARAQRRRMSTGATVAAYLLVNVVGHIAFAATLAVAVALLVADGRFTSVDAVATVVFVVFSSIQFAAIAAAIRSPSALRRLYSLPGQILARVRPHRAADQKRLPAPFETGINDLCETGQLLRSRPRRAAPVLGHAILLELIGVAQLWCVLEALGSHVALRVPLVAYAVSVLFTTVGFLPGGLGFVEASVGTLLVSFGYAGPTAAAAVALYRLFELWLPMLFGAIAAHHLAPSRSLRD